MENNQTKLHFIGIGGIGVSAVARIAIGRGFRVSGSDVRRSALTDAMERLGARVMIGHRTENLDGCELVVVSTAIPEHNVELATAKANGIPTIHRSDLLARFLADCGSIGVTGTHGKGTTAAMITSILDSAGWDPGFIIGGLLLNYGVNARAGSGKWIVAEVDESDGSHQNVPVEYLLCNYLEADHLNYYRDLDHIIETMAAAANANPRLKSLFVNVDCDGNRRLLTMVSKPVVTYGFSADADFRAEFVDRSQLPLRFRVYKKGEFFGAFEIPLPGRYNVTNAVGAIAVANALGASAADCARGLETFRGLENRYTIEDAAGVKIVKDYNSHPTAIRKVLESAKDLAAGRIISVFKPYRYTLTSYLKDEYATAFHDSDEAIITTMYAANEDPIPGVDTEFVVGLLRAGGIKVTHIPDQNEIVSYLEKTVQTGDKVIFFGGDDFFSMADAWANTRRARMAPNG